MELGKGVNKRYEETNYESVFTIRLICDGDLGSSNIWRLSSLRIWSKLDAHRTSKLIIIQNMESIYTEFKQNQVYRGPALGRGDHHRTAAKRQRLTE